MKYGILFIIVILFSGFSQSEIEWEKKYNSMKEERDMYRKTSEMLLKNWKECEEKVTKIISEQVN
jgi:hypothetical protein